MGPVHPSANDSRFVRAPDVSGQARPNYRRYEIKEQMTMPTRFQTGTNLTSRLLTIKDASEILQVSVKTICRWIDTGDLTAHRIGRQWRISQGDLETFIRMRRQG